MSVNVKHITSNVITAALVSVMFLAAGCSEKHLLDAQGTTTVTLNAGLVSLSSPFTKSGGTEDSNVLPYEGLRTLRVIIISKADTPEARRILYNEKFDVEELSPEDITKPKLSASVTLEDVPMGPASVYVIANEESIIDVGEDGTGGYTDEILMGDTYKADNKLLVRNTESQKHFPKRYEDIGNYGLPMSGRDENVTITENAQIGITLTRAVVKLNLQVVNATTETINLNKVAFGPFVSDRVYMFRAHSQSLDIPTGTEYQELVYDSNSVPPLYVPIEQNKSTSWMPVYIYPNNAPRQTPSRYSITLGTDNKEDGYESVLGISYMIRNTQFNITATITARAMVEITYSQVPWNGENGIAWEDGGDRDVPSFN